MAELLFSVRLLGCGLRALWRRFACFLLKGKQQCQAIPVIHPASSSILLVCTEFVALTRVESLCVSVCLSVCLCLSVALCFCLSLSLTPSLSNPCKISLSLSNPCKIKFSSSRFSLSPYPLSLPLSLSLSPSPPLSLSLFIYEKSFKMCIDLPRCLIVLRRPCAVHMTIGSSY